jgi:hypothetical protein
MHQNPRRKQKMGINLMTSRSNKLYMHEMKLSRNDKKSKRSFEKKLSNATIHSSKTKHLWEIQRSRILCLLLQ